MRKKYSSIFNLRPNGVTSLSLESIIEKLASRMYSKIFQWLEKITFPNIWEIEKNDAAISCYFYVVFREDSKKYFSY